MQPVEQPQQDQQAQPVEGSWDASYTPPEQEPVTSVYVDPPTEEPAPVEVAWAPPPMLVEDVPPAPYDDGYWVGGYWVWQGAWVWSHGHWHRPPQPGYHWCNPYYEHRGNGVVFINGFWAAPGVNFVAPGINIRIAAGIVAAGVIAGVAPVGPQGVFIPAPPGSQRGLIVPAPIGVAPAVVMSAPPIIHEGMHITVNNTVNNNIHNTTNITNVTNITHVTVVAPASATANGRAVNAVIPAQPHLAAALPHVVRAVAPQPASNTPIPSYVAGHQPVALPAPQPVHAALNPAVVAAHPVNRPAPTVLTAPPHVEPQHSAPSAPNAPAQQPHAVQMNPQEHNVPAPVQQQATPRFEPRPQEQQRPQAPAAAAPHVYQQQPEPARQERPQRQEYTPPPQPQVIQHPQPQAAPPQPHPEPRQEPRPEPHMEQHPQPQPAQPHPEPHPAASNPKPGESHPKDKDQTR
jgi:hypothetical protein